MKVPVKVFIVFALALRATGLHTPAALAAAPTNDTSANATLVSPGFSELLDTTEATTDADDAQVNASCGAPVTDASVWYTLVGTGEGVIIDVSPSNYSAGVLVGIGSPGNLQTVTCSQGSVAFPTEAGTTYFILAFDDQLDGSGNGGNLSIAFNLVPPPPTVSVTVFPFGSFNSKTGVAKISGTYTCTGSDFLDVTVDASQVAGRLTVMGTGFFLGSNTCDGASHNWTAEVYPHAGKFAGGKALSVTVATACGFYECGRGYAEQKVILRGLKK